MICGLIYQDKKEQATKIMCPALGRNRSLIRTLKLTQESIRRAVERVQITTYTGRLLILQCDVRLAAIHFFACLFLSKSGTSLDAIIGKMKGMVIRSVSKDQSSKRIIRYTFSLRLFGRPRSGAKQDVQVHYDFQDTGRDARIRSRQEIFDPHVRLPNERARYGNDGRHCWSRWDIHADGRQQEADIILFNTCAIRENAEDKVFGEIGHLKPLKTENPNLILGVCGCMSQEESVVNRILQKHAFVDLIFGTHNIHRLPAFSERSDYRQGNGRGSVVQGRRHHRKFAEKAGRDESLGQYYVRL